MSDEFQVLFISGIDKSTTIDDLWEVFDPWSENIKSIKLRPDHFNPRAPHHAYVNFTSHESAQDSLSKIQPLFINYTMCRVAGFNGESVVGPRLVEKVHENGLFIKNIASDVGVKELYGLFSSFGKIVGVNISIDAYGVSRNFGYVTYDNPKSAETAISELDGHTLRDRELSVNPNLPRDQRAHRLYVKFETNYADTSDQENATSKDRVQSDGEQKPDPDSSEPSGALDDNPIVDVDESDIDSAFKKFQSYQEAVFPRRNDGKPKGYALVLVGSEEDADRAIKEVKEIKNIPVNVSVAQSHRSESKTAVELNNLFIKNIAGDITEEVLTEEFGQFGEIVSAKIMLDEEGKSRQFGFVKFADTESAFRAIEALNGAERWGKTLLVTTAQRQNKFGSQGQNWDRSFGNGYRRQRFNNEYRDMYPQMNTMPSINGGVPMGIPIAGMSPQGMAQAMPPSILAANGIPQPMSQAIPNVAYANMMGVPSGMAGGYYYIPEYGYDYPVFMRQPQVVGQDFPKYRPHESYGRGKYKIRTRSRSASPAKKSSASYSLRNGGNRHSNSSSSIGSSKSQDNASYQNTNNNHNFNNLTPPTTSSNTNNSPAQRSNKPVATGSTGLNSDPRGKTVSEPKSTSNANTSSNSNSKRKAGDKKEESDQETLEQLSALIHPLVINHKAVHGKMDVANKVTAKILQNPTRQIYKWLADHKALESVVQACCDSL